MIIAHIAAAGASAVTVWWRLTSSQRVNSIEWWCFILFHALNVGVQVYSAWKKRRRRK